MLSISSNDTYDPLFSTQKEAHATEFLAQDSANKVITLPSGDTKIIVLCEALLRKDRVFIDNGLEKAITSI